MAVTLTKIQCDSPTPTYSALPVPLEKNTSNNHSTSAESVSFLHSKLLPSPLSQPVIQHSLPPRPPAVVPSSTINWINSYSSYSTDFDRSIHGLVSVTGRATDKDGVSAICVPAKENIGSTYDHRTSPDPRSPCQTMPIAGPADSTAPSTPERSRTRGQLDPLLELGWSEPRAVHVDRGLDPADLEIEPSTASGPERPGLDIEYSEPVSDADDDAPGSGDRWEYRRIKARRIDSLGRRMVKVEWEDTWEPEDQLDGFKTALRRYARERQMKRDSEGTCSKCGARKRRCPV